MQIRRQTMPVWRSVLALTTAILAGGCSIRRLPARVMGPVFDDVAKALYRQTDLELAKDGLPAFLLMIDGLLESSPNDQRLLLAGAQAYSAYAMAFVEDENPDRATRLYARATDYALRALWPGTSLDQAQRQRQAAFGRVVSRTPKQQGPALYWTASCWASWIVCNAGSADAIADLPKVECLMTRALEIDETYQHGGPHLFMGVYHAARPKQLGGRPDLAKKHFQKAIDIAGDACLIAKVYFAKCYARQTFDQELHDRLLGEVVAAKIDEKSDLALINAIAKARAQRLLQESEEFF